ncbi:hypothetical protein HYT55_01630 [Candidatus Woesearchaeota archaeon]|nr:hypothetical protein [Candidatus Woesearchaeota archaeon]
MVCSPFIVTHGEDPDGVISHALLWQLCEQGYKEEPAGHSFLRYDTLSDELPSFVEIAQAGHPCNLFVADINFNPANFRRRGKKGLLDPLREATTFMHWIDHHEGTRTYAKRLHDKGIFVSYSPNQCAALQIARHNKLLGDPYFRQLAQIAQAHDYARTGDVNDAVLAGNKLEGIIALGNASENYDLLLGLAFGLKERTVLTTDLGLVDEPWGEIYGQYEQHKAEALSELEKTLLPARVDNARVLFACASPILSQKPAPRYLRERYGSHYDTIVCFFGAPYRNHIILGNEASPFDIVGACRALGGGGRNNSGGFTRKKAITDFKDYQTACQEVALELHAHQRKC